MKNLKLKLSIFISIFILLFQVVGSSAYAFTVSESANTTNGVSVDVKQIKELADLQSYSNSATPSQALAQTVATLVSRDSVGPQGNFTAVYTAQTVLKYLYPNDTNQQLQGATITPDQAVAWLHSVGYTATIVNRPLTTAEIKANLDKSEPIVPILANQNTGDWLLQNYAGILYAHDDVTAGSQQLHKSFVKSVNFGEAEIQDGTEAQPFAFSDMTNSPDPMEQKDTFKWVSTITDIKRDPEYTNALTINGNKQTGVFATKVTKSGNQSEVDFTDPAVTGLLNKFPQTNTDQTTKLAAVSLINLYEDAAHQKTVSDLDNYLNISADTYVSSQQVESWYQYLGFDFDTVSGRAPLALTQAVNQSGRLYLTLLKAESSANAVKNTAVIGTGYLNNTANGYSPYWVTTKSGENISPFYNTPLTTAGFAKYQQEAKIFSYTNLVKVTLAGTSISKTSYDEDATIYNIRAKGTPDSTEVPTSSATKSSSTPAPTLTNTLVSNAKYINTPNFEIRETQGQQEWCSEFVNAAAVNTVDKTVDDTSPITAQAIMQADYPNLSGTALDNVAGSSYSDILKILQTKYGVTADIVNRPLTFAEVKKQIDNGEIVQMDAYDQKISATDTSEGHALAIVGYVMPASGNTKQAPYYVVWNPWWNQYFYLSSASSSFTLAGMTFTWKSSWYNWRKSSTVGSINGVAAKQNVTKEDKPSTNAAPISNLSMEQGQTIKMNISKPSQFSMINSWQKFSSPNNNEQSTQKVFNHMTSLTPSSPKLTLPSNHLSSLSIPNNQQIAEMGAETNVYDILTNTTYGYAESIAKDPFVKGAFVRIRMSSAVRVYKSGSDTTKFEEDINGMRKDLGMIGTGVAFAVISAILDSITDGASVPLLIWLASSLNIAGPSSVVYALLDFYNSQLNANSIVADLHYSQG